MDFNNTNIASGIITLAHEDSRRIISEFNSNEGDFAVKHFLVKEQLPLGNHYHTKKTEVFIVLKGQGILRSCPIDKATGKPIGDVETKELDNKSVVAVPAYVAHTFTFEPGSEVLCFSSKAFNEEDKDMVPYPLM